MDLEQFLRKCRVLKDGFSATHPDDVWRLGGVIFVESADGFAAVQKATKRDYELSGSWALPGGMMRATAQSEPMRDQIDKSLRDRARAEASLNLTTVEPLGGLGPVVARYTAKKRQRYTLVAPFRGLAPSAPRLLAADPSIKTAHWIAPPTDLSAFAPANRLILAHHFWRCLDEHHQSVVKDSVLEALEACGNHAIEAGIAKPVAPWASTNERRDWARSWPS